MTGSVDPIDFILAENLSKTLSEVGDMPNLDIVKWRAFYTWRAAMRDLDTKEAE